VAPSAATSAAASANRRLTDSYARRHSRRWVGCSTESWNNGQMVALDWPS
jgi:hypothetical protein